MQPKQKKVHQLTKRSHKSFLSSGAIIMLYLPPKNVYYKKPLIVSKIRSEKNNNKQTSR